MATVTVRNLDDEVRRLLKIRAAVNNRSMEAEVRAILTAAVIPAVVPATTVEGSGAPVPATLPTPPPLQGSALTPREDHIAALVAEGLTNRQIAAQLFLSERTVEVHVSTILRKLSFQSRATIASWFTARPSLP